MTKELVPYSEFTEQMEALRDRADFLPDMSTKEGYEVSRRISLDYRKIEIRVDDERKKQKKYWIAGGKAVDAKGKGIEGEIFKLRDAHAEAYQKVDAEKKEREAKRVAILQDALEYIRNLPSLMGPASSEEVQGAMEEMKEESCEGFYEFTAAALEARNATRETLGALYIDKVNQEKDAADLKELRAKQAKQDELDRQAAAVKSATEKVEREKSKAIERETAAKEATKVAEQNAVNAKAEAEDKAFKAADKARLDEVARQEAVKSEDARQEAARLANVEHCRNINLEAVCNLMEHAKLTKEQATEVVKSIARKQISNITINY